MKRSDTWMGKGAREHALNDTKEWARLMLTSGSWKDALTASVSFTLERLSIYQALSKESFEPPSDRCHDKIADVGNSVVNARQYDEAVSQYTAALSLDPTSLQDLLVTGKQSKACAEKGEWKNPSNDANETIKLDPPSPLGCERKYAVLLSMEYAIDAFETMLLKISRSSDPEIRELSRYYVWPEQTKEVIRTSIQDVLHDSPLVLINALSGRLCDRSGQAAAFKSAPAFTTLVTLLHTWEGNEPLYGKATKILVYDLEASPSHNKLQMFCKIVRDQGFNWAWSDTCYIDKGDDFILQEALVSMFKWYEGSAMTIICGALMMSKWNSRRWTLQEYHASKAVRTWIRASLHGAGDPAGSIAVFQPILAYSTP
ncbi:hypothetical protein JVU11DRAFT_3837 [Chiua virens]|nr:hypothetical protein JVU11DRAFT_3837 [Chiua virens]